MHNFLLLAKSSLDNVRTTPADKGLSLEWGLVLIGLIIGLAITLMPPTHVRSQEAEGRLRLDVGCSILDANI